MSKVPMYTADEQDRMLRADVALQVTGDYARCICEVSLVLNVMRDQRHDPELERMLRESIETMTNTYVVLCAYERECCRNV